MAEAELLPAAVVVLWATALVLYLRGVGRLWWWASASNLSVAHASVFLLATYFTAERSRDAGAVAWCYTVLAGVVAMVLGCWAASERKGVRTRTLAERFHHSPLAAAVSVRMLALLSAITAVGIVVVVLFLRSLAGNVLLEILRQGARGVPAREVVAIRKHSVYGAGFESGDYMAPGYVAQFRSRLLPLIAAAGLVGFLLARRHRRWLLALLLAAGVSCTIANGATGQRAALIGPFAFVGYLCLVRYYCSAQSLARGIRRILHGLGITAVLAGVALFSALTLALGRAEFGTELPEQFLRTVGAGFRRVFVVPAETDVGSIEILHRHRPALGRGWARGMLMPLPNPIEERITRDWSPVGTPTWLHVQHGGSYEGNAPLTRWGSLWFNFRFPGVVLLGFVAGYLTQCYDRWCLRWRKTPLSIVCWQMGAISIATAATPADLLLTGLAAAMILMGLNQLLARQRLPAPSPEADGLAS